MLPARIVLSWPYCNCCNPDRFGRISAMETLGRSSSSSLLRGCKLDSNCYCYYNITLRHGSKCSLLPTCTLRLVASSVFNENTVKLKIHPVTQKPNSPRRLVLVETELLIMPTVASFVLNAPVLRHVQRAYYHRREKLVGFLHVL